MLVACPLRISRHALGCLRPFSSSALRKPISFDREKMIGISARAIEAPGRPLSSVLQLPMVYARLCKAKLSGLVVCTTLAGYLIAPMPSGFLACLGTGNFWSTIVGTALCAGAANAWNQWAESSHDARMLRTRCRPLPTRQISSVHAFGWASACAVTGLSTLYIGSGHIAMALAATTIGLYTLVYTPLKRYSVINTWVGSVVGALPPLIGYAGALHACGLSTWQALLPDAALLGAILFCWQFPHFNALAFNLKEDYNRAGYCMASIFRPTLNTASAVVHAAALIPLTVALSPLGTGLASYGLLVDGGLLATWLTVKAVLFYRRPGRGTARRLFLASLLYLPLFLACLVAHKAS